MNMNTQVISSGGVSRIVQKIDLRRIPVVAKQQIDTAQLPALYKAAVAALKQCDRIDELKDIEDKHSAIAHYAKQIKDNQLLYHAERIKLRAFERIGELLKELSPEKRKAMADASGIPVSTANRAVEAAQIPKRVRDQMIEADIPPSKKRLWEAGRGYGTTPMYQNEGLRRYLHKEKEIKHTAERQAYEMFRYLKAVEEDIESFRQDGCGSEFSMSQLGRAIDLDDSVAVKKVIVGIVELLDEFEVAIPGKKV